MPNNNSEDGDYLKVVNEFGGEAKDEEIKNSRISPTMTTEKLQDAFVQTVFETTDVQCQCDLVKTNLSGFVLIMIPDENKLKSPSNELSSALTLKDDNLLDEEKKHTDRCNTYQEIKTKSRMRLGLSRHVKPRQ